MPKNRYSLSKKHEYLIDKLNEIPTMEDIRCKAWTKDMLYGLHTDFRYNTEDILLNVIERLTKGTQMEDIGREISDKAREIFDYYGETN